MAELNGIILFQSTQNTDINLTAEGTESWIKWDTTTLNIEKATGVGVFGPLQEVNSPSFPFDNASGKLRFNWTDGTPELVRTSPNDDGRSVYFATDSGNAGYSFTVPATEDKRILRVYTSSFGANGYFTCTLSDGSAPPINIALNELVTLGGEEEAGVEIEYSSTSNSATLLVEFIDNSAAGGNWRAMTLMAASLSVVEGDFASGISSTSSISADLSLSKQLSSTISITTDIGGTLSAGGTFTSFLPHSTEVIGTLNTNISLSADLQASSTLSGNLDLDNTYSISISTTSDVSASIITDINLSAAITNSSSVAADLTSLLGGLAGTISNTSTVSGILSVEARFSATISSKPSTKFSIGKADPRYDYISSDVQRLDPGTILDFYEIDTSSLPGGGVLRFHTGVNGINQSIYWQGVEYTPYPVEVTGFEYTGQGATPRPKLVVANINGLISSLVIQFNDLVGLKVTRRRTFKRYIDDVNFADGFNPTADPNASFADEIYYIDKKVRETKIFIEFELASALDLNGIKLPRRQVIIGCTWKYRSAECSYDGPPVATKLDEATTDESLDECGKRLTSCKFRFGEGILPYGGFPSVGKIR